MSTEIQEFVNQLLRGEPGEPHSVQLELDTEGDTHGLFEALLLIMTEILKRWYAPPITIGRISSADMHKLIGYFASFGIQLHVSSEEIPRVFRLNNSMYLQKSQLEDMKFQMTDGGSRAYTVRFSNLPAM